MFLTLLTVSITVVIIVMVAVVLRSRADTDPEVELSTNLHREDPCSIRAFYLFKAPTSAFTIKNLLWHNAEWMLNMVNIHGIGMLIRPKIITFITIGGVG